MTEFFSNIDDISKNTYIFMDARTDAILFSFLQNFNKSDFDNFLSNYKGFKSVM